MRNILSSFLLVGLLLTTQAQTLRADSATSRDNTVTLHYQVPENHGQNAIRILENNQTIFRGIAFLDGTTADTATLTFTNRTEGYKIYHVAANMLAEPACDRKLYVLSNTAVQVGNAACCQVPFTDITGNGVRSIRYRFGLCPFPTSGSQRYTVTFRRLNAYDPNVFPSLSTPVQASGNRLTNYVPTLQERGQMQVMRTSSTDFGNQWYRVDVFLYQAGCTNNRSTGFVYVWN